MSRRPQPTALRLAIGRAVRARRVAMGISQAELAARCYSTKGTLAHLEGGRNGPSMGLLVMLADALATEPWVLLKEAHDAMREGKAEAAE